MIIDLLQSVNRIYLAYGATDFRKQIPSLCSIVKNHYKMNPYNKSAYIFCNKKRNSIRVLCYDKNGFILGKRSMKRRIEKTGYWYLDPNPVFPLFFKI